MTNSSSPLGFASRFGLAAKDLYPSARHATGLLKSGRGEDALRVFVGLVLAAPEDVGFQLGLSESALAAGRPEIALQAASAVISLDKDNAMAFFASGRACLALGEPELALQDLTDAVRLAEAAPANAEDRKAAGKAAARLLAGLGDG